jgi:membrane associated rhomboid family serine protease
MIPLRDTIPVRTFPIVNTGVIVLNAAVFLVEFLLGPEELNRLIGLFGLTPAVFWQSGGLQAWITLITAQFLHGGWWHLISNMLALYIFGDNIEDRLGHGRYAIFYLASGLAAHLAHLLAQSGSSVPTIGASGAIAGVLGAYLVLFPRARVVTLVPIFYFIRIIQVPALVYLGFWFVSQLFSGLFALSSTGALQAGGVAWWEHIGGFIFGLVMIRLALPRRPRQPPERFQPW